MVAVACCLIVPLFFFLTLKTEKDMGRRLTDNISSQYIEAANRLASKKARRRIVAYVESYDDVFFWRSVLRRFENDRRYFEVMLPSRLEHLERGKKAAIMSLLEGGAVGRDMIACVDADYDYLLQGASPASRCVVENPYVLHTYAYSIENMQSYAASLHDVCVAVTLSDNVTFDFEAFLRDFSQAVFPLFVWNVWSYKTMPDTRFSISDFNKTIELGNVTPENAGQLVQRLRQRVDRKVAQLKRQYPGAKDSVAAVKEEIKRLGVSPEQTYMYIQGHHLFDKVIVPLMRKVCGQLVAGREKEIARQSVHATQYRNEMACYTSSLGDVGFMLRRNIGFMLSPQYRQLESDIVRLLGMDDKTDEMASGQDKGEASLRME